MRVLGDGEDVAVGVFEPGDFGGAVGCGPDTGRVLFEEGVVLEGDSSGGELLCGGDDVGDLPAEDRVGSGVEGFHASDADVSGVGTDDDGELVVGDEGEAKGVDVKAAGALGIDGGDEGEEFGLGEQECLLCC